MSFGVNLCNIECGYCGHSADLNLFISTPVGGDLPRGQYQCPKCRRAWRMVAQDEGTLYPGGLYVPPTTKQQEVTATL